MCGIVAVITRNDDRPLLESALLAPVLLQAAQELVEIVNPVAQTSQLRQAADLCRTVNHRLRSLPGVRCLVGSAQVQAEVSSAAQKLAEELTRIDSLLDAAGLDLAGVAITEATELAGQLADSVFAIARDRLRTAAAIADLYGNASPVLASPVSASPVSPNPVSASPDPSSPPSASPGPPAAAISGLWAIQVALSSLDRLEVRGRDSAGLQVFVANGATPAGGTPFVYKVAAEIGELGDNTAALREQISNDQQLHAALSEPGCQVSVLAHTRWASVGIISEPNAHPLDGTELDETGLGDDGLAGTGLAGTGSDLHCAAVLNGDVDNYATLKERNGLRIAPEITTDAKAIPTLLRRSLLSHRAELAEPGTSNTGSALLASFATTVDELEGSVAIAAHTAAAPSTLLLALHGSGQSLYVSSTANSYIVASEPYGLVEEVDHYLRMNGEVSANPDNPVGSRGQIILLDVDTLPPASPVSASSEIGSSVSAKPVSASPVSASPAQTNLLSVARYSYDGTQLPVADTEITTAEITTRDIDRSDAPHFFLKEIREAPRSFRTTLRGRIEHYDLANHEASLARVVLEDSALPPNVRALLRDGAFKNIVAIGQGTAAIAAAALPHFCELLRAASDGAASFPQVSACLATELSGFGLSADMSDTLLVAVSQSGTTTDLNRTVDLARERGAVVLAIVNRRNSDLTERADGVLYTSDGRDVEMSVASTKAFYAQVAAIALLSVAMVAELTQPGPTQPGPTQSGYAEFVTDLLNALEAMPAAIEEVLASRAEIALIARRHIGYKRHWAVVGNGANYMAAREIRIKLSELCYHAVAEDSTENKKHIDLSSEPLIIVCAAGEHSSVSADIAKEVDIYRAHRSVPVVFASKTNQFADPTDVFAVPAVHPALDFVLATVAGHLFAYEAARVIDSLADPLREMRVSVEAAIGRYMAPAPAAVSTAPASAASAAISPAAATTAPIAPTPATTAGTKVGELLAGVAVDIAVPANRLQTALQAGSYDGHLRVATALRLATVLPFVQGITPLESYQQTLGKVGTPATVLEDLEGALNTAIDELTRPIDTIKHQAKSVTVGISRAEDSLLLSVLVAAALAAGAPRDRLSYAALQTLAALDPAVEEVIGYTRYRIDGEVTADSGALHEAAIDLTRLVATINVTDRGGIAREITSRTSDDSRLRGTKHRAAFEREVTVGRGRDGRTVIHIPETKDGRVVGLTLLHCQFATTIAAHQMRAVLRGYRGRYGALTDAVTEVLPAFRDEVLGQIDVVDLLTRPVYVLAESWMPAESKPAAPSEPAPASS